MYCKIYINVLVYLCSYKHYTQKRKSAYRYANKPMLWMLMRYIQSMNANEEMLAGYADTDASYPDADPDAT